MKKSILICSLLLITCSLLFAQTADRIEQLLEQDSVSYAQAALFVLEAAERLPPNTGASLQAAFNTAIENNFLPKDVMSNDTVNLMGLSLLVMKAFDMQGGLFYTLTKSQRHAYRELQRLDVVQGRTDPSLLVTGEMLLFIVNRILFVKPSEDSELQGYNR